MLQPGYSHVEPCEVSCHLSCHEFNSSHALAGAVCLGQAELCLETPLKRSRSLEFG